MDDCGADGVTVDVDDVIAAAALHDDDGPLTAAAALTAVVGTIGRAT